MHVSWVFDDFYELCAERHFCHVESHGARLRSKNHVDSHIAILDLGNLVFTEHVFDSTHA